jgi:hypothetical protein
MALWFETHGSVASLVVMPGLVPGIHVFASLMGKKDVDGRDEARP